MGDETYFTIFSLASKAAFVFLGLAFLFRIVMHLLIANCTVGNFCNFLTISHNRSQPKSGSVYKQRQFWKFLIRKCQCQQEWKFCLVCKILLKSCVKHVVYLQQRLFLVQQRTKKEERKKTNLDSNKQKKYCNNIVAIINSIFYFSSPQFSCQAQRPASWYERNRHLRMRSHR